VVGAAFVAGACSSDNSGFNPKTAKGPDKTCVIGELTVGSAATGDLSAASACSYPQFFDSANTAIAVSYNFGAEKGKGYLISLQSNWENQASLIGTASGVPATLAYADYDHQWQATLAFVATGNTGYSVRVGAYDANPVDTGAYTLRAQSCKVPIPTVTDSVTHSDNLTPSDCMMPLGDFDSEDSTYVHLYAIQFDSGASRNIYITAADSSVTFNLGGPGFDPYGYYNNSARISAYGVTDGSGTFTAAAAGVYTLVIGTSHYTTTTAPYTITFGAQQPATVASRVPSSPGLAATRGKHLVRATGTTSWR
jgi:hypothetical protein